MTSISVDKALFEDLLSFKLRRLSEDIQAILAKWHYMSGKSFLEDVRSGKLKEAEMDAIELHQLLYDQDILLKIKEKQW